MAWGPRSTHNTRYTPATTRGQREHATWAVGRRPCHGQSSFPACPGKLAILLVRFTDSRADRMTRNLGREGVPLIRTKDLECKRSYRYRAKAKASPFPRFTPRCVSGDLLHRCSAVPIAEIGAAGRTAFFSARESSPNPSLKARNRPLRLHIDLLGWGGSAAGGRPFSASRISIVKKKRKKRGNLCPVSTEETTPTNTTP